MAAHSVYSLLRIHPFLVVRAAFSITGRQSFQRVVVINQQKSYGIHDSSVGDQENGKPRRSKPVSGKGKSRIQHFRKVMNQFVVGSKSLGSDVKRMVGIRRKLKEHGYNWDALTADETLHMTQVRQDLIKTLPAVLVFCIPFLGYAAPLIAFMYPKHLLSHHYWLPCQEQQFRDHDALKRSNHYLPLVREVGRQALQEKRKDRDLEDLLDVSLKTINKKHPTNEELLKSSDKFSGVLGFNSLPKYHLKRLSHAWLLWPWLPRRLLRGNLRRKLASIKKEDAALKRDGLDSLDEIQIKRLCHCRGLQVQSLEHEALKAWLTEWVELASHSSDHDDSFLAHIAIYKTMNYHRNPSNNTQS
ncbi:predicted protein [Nematostella vectensis]|uniref:Letm1 RBD domain-containing protein n=1 Tax=Nematostella vectensis TaxID=45351 RepID=A7RXP3_NEMVE|nr:predicted protein [Nematostella vectensis]|eukprot:XP_001635943.1 predicted protein [Nematostella vectensis]